MSGLLLPACSIFFSSLLIIIFYSKKRINLVENKLYSIMIMSSFFDSCLASILQIFVKNGFTNTELFLIPWINRLDFVFLIIYTACLLFYTLVISYPNFEKRIKKGIKPFIYLYVLSILLIMISDINIINKGTNFSVDGTAVNLTYLTCGFNVLASVFIAIANCKKKDKRYIPLFAIIGLAIFLLIAFKINPYLIIISIAFTYIDYIMFHTIENPDLKMIDELVVAKDQAEKYSNDKAVFLFNMSQQIRTPLKSIERLTNEISDETDINIIKEHVNNIKTFAQRLNYIFNDSLDISTIEAKNLKITEAKYNIKSLINQVVKKVQDDLKYKEVAFNLVVSDSLPDKLYGDSIRLKQILNTLLFNAVKYTEKGFVELNIDVVIKYDVCRLIIKVEDSGCGIKKEMLNKLFEKHDSENLSTDDSCLTLDTLKKMLNLIGGTIMVQSEIKKGTQFTVILDQKVVEEEQDEMSKMISKYKTKKKKSKQKLLFIDDKDNLKNVIKMIDTSLYSITHVNGGEDALNKLRKKELFDLIFIDEDLSKLDTLATFDRMHLISGFDTPVIILSQYTDKKTILKYKSLGFDNVLFKPVKLKDLDLILEKYNIETDKED